MTHMWAARSSTLLFQFFTLPFLLILVISLVLGGQITEAEPAIGSVLSYEKPLMISTLGMDIYLPSLPCSPAPFMQAIPTQTQAGSACGVILKENGYILSVV